MYSNRILLGLLLTFATPLLAAGRFSGSAGLSVNPVQTSADARIALTAELQPAPAVAKATVDGRFGLSAELVAPKSLATACGPVSLDIFKNGFEN